jgi:deoxycytidylate deaminase
MSTLETSSDSAVQSKNNPELVFAMVRAIGADSNPVVTELTSLLYDARFSVSTVQLSERFKNVEFLAPTLRDSPENERYRTYMDAGDLLRSATQRGDAAAVLGVMDLRQHRDRLLLAGSKSDRGRAYLLKSLMHPHELQTLRRVYGTQLFAIAVFAPRDIRVKRLAQKIADSWGTASERWLPDAEELVNRDLGIRRQEDDVTKAVETKYALDVQKTFQKADLFISATAPEESSEAVRRFIELIFGYPFHTPTREEFGMCMAHSAAARSSSLGRSVGAAILTNEGDVVTVGSNEVPAFGGGQYWAGDKPDGRSFVQGYDSSDRIRRQMFADLVRRLHTDRVWAKGHPDSADLAALNRVLDGLDLDSTVNELFKSATIGKASVLDVIEYGREVHAEMAALTDAAKRGVSVKGCVLYCTTFPCHECARLIVSAGIHRVVYIEPYPKSRVSELYDDSIGLADRRTELGNRVRFEPFVGIAPRRYFDLFSWVPRKAADTPGGRQDYSGTIAPWSIGMAALRDTITDQESLDSGARANSIECGELENVKALNARLAEAKRKWDAMKADPNIPSPS